MGIYEFYGCLGSYGCPWVYIGFYGCLWVVIGFFGFLDVYAYLWVARVAMGMGIYLNVKNIAYFLIQEPQKIWKLQKTSGITYVL